MTEFPLTAAKALRFAMKKHGDQRYGTKPYKHHLLAVQSVAFEFQVTDPDILIATLLHDTIEDTDATYDEVAAYFGERVAKLVQAVSNVEYHPETGEKLKNRKQKAQFTYPQILSVPGATILKLCDRIANVRSCWIEATDMDANKRNKSKIGMYKKEYGGFRKALRVDVGFTAPMWVELDRLLVWES